MAFHRSLSHKTLIIVAAALTTSLVLQCSEKPLVYIQLEKDPFNGTLFIEQVQKTYSDLFQSIVSLQKRPNVSQKTIKECKIMLEKEYDKRLYKEITVYSSKSQKPITFYTPDIFKGYKNIVPALEEFLKSKKFNKTPLIQASTLNTFENTLILLEDNYKKINTQPEEYYKSLALSPLPLQGQLKKIRDNVISLYDKATQKTGFFLNRFVDVPYTTILQAVTQTPKFKSELLSAPEKKAITLLKNNFKELITSTQMIGQLARSSIDISAQLQNKKEIETMYKKLCAYSSYYMTDEELSSAFEMTKLELFSAFGTDDDDTDDDDTDNEDTDDGKNIDTKYTTKLGIITRYANLLDKERKEIYLATRLKSMHDVSTALVMLKKKLEN